MRPHSRIGSAPLPTHNGSSRRGHALAHDIHAVVSAGEELLRTKADLLFTRLATMIAEPPPVGAGKAPEPASQRLNRAIGLIYELLDAHDDTARLAGERARDPAWQAQLEYLRALQRTGRAVLARIALEEGDQ